MSLTASLHVGRTALNASQVAIQVTGNNFANAATPGYSRQVVNLAPDSGTRSGSVFLGRGVHLGGVQRQVDQAIQDRLWDATSRQASAGVDLELLSTLETTLNELTESDLSSEMSRFFNAWSQLANTPTSEGARSLVIRQGSTLAGALRSMRADLTSQRDQVDAQIRSSVSRANEILSQIAASNAEIVAAEVGSATENSLRDQRDALISELAAFVDAQAVEQPSGSVDILIGSTPVVIGDQNRGIDTKVTAVDGVNELDVVLGSDRRHLDIPPEGGRIGALLAQRSSAVDSTIDRLDAVASQLIFQINRIHSTGYGTAPLTSTRSSRTVDPAHASLALNDPNNATFANLPFRAANGGFNVTVTNRQTHSAQTVRIEVDLDGLDSTGAPGFTDDTSVADIQAALDGIANLSATLNADGTISIAAAGGFEVSFSDDSSAILALLGVNGYFAGTDARDIAVEAALEATPGLLATGRESIGGDSVENGAALAIARLPDLAIDDLGGMTLTGAWTDATQDLAVKTGAARTRADAATLVRDSLEAQRAGISGVSTDEEAINLITYQRQYQGAARFISAVDELTQTLLSIV